MRNDGYLTPDDAAFYLRISKSTLAKRRVYQSSPKFTRIGRAIRYRRSDLDEFMAARLVDSTSAPLIDHVAGGPYSEIRRPPLSRSGK